MKKLIKTIKEWITQIWDLFTSYNKHQTNAGKCSKATTISNIDRRGLAPDNNAIIESNTPQKIIKQHEQPYNINTGAIRNWGPSINMNREEIFNAKKYCVLYDKFFHSLDYFYYPTLLVPSKGTLIKPPQKFRQGNTGRAEAIFKNFLDQYFKCTLNIDTDLCLKVKGKDFPYEPDIVLWMFANDSLVLIDIEIDEPYCGYEKRPTHFQGIDIERNIDFLNRGWIVIRFAEEQIIKKPENCCYIIANLLSEIIPEYQIPENLKQYDTLDKLKYWQQFEVEAFIDQKIRENLYKIDSFAKQEDINPGKLLTDIYNDIEQAIIDQYKEFRHLIEPKTKFSNIPNKTISGKKPTNQKTIADSTDIYRGTFLINEVDTVNEYRKEKIKFISKKTKAIDDNLLKIDRQGDLNKDGTAAKPTRHHGGKFDKRISELMRPKHQPYLKASIQQMNIERKFEFLKCNIIGNKLICRGFVQHEGIDRYQIRIEYKEGYYPKVFIDFPEIDPSIHIHMYSDKSLCLFYHPDLKWNDYLNIAEYFVPWTIEWIYNYELYKLTGKWEHEESPLHQQDLKKGSKENQGKLL